MNIPSLLKRKDTDMTEGNVFRHLITFALPLLIGYLFQQLYNTVDCIVVGQCVSSAALAAVGTTGPIINTFIGFFIGFSAGAGAVISQYYGAHDDENVSSAVHTTITIAMILCVIFTIAGVKLVPAMLRLMDTPIEVFPDAVEYLTIYFSGLSGLLMYNICAGILRAVGDSQRPLYFLIFSAVTNTVLDLIFVLVFGMKIDGVAYATIISQALSMVLVLLVLARSNGAYKFDPRKLGITWRHVGSILKIGLPAGLQMTITAFSNVFVQKYINAFGPGCMAGWSSYSKLDQFCLLPMQSVSMATTTFVGQNLGAGNIERARKGPMIGLKAAVLATAILVIPFVTIPDTLLRLFNDETDILFEDVLHYGRIFLRFFSPFYLLCCVNQVLAGSLRGAGDSKAPMFIMLSSFVLCRQIYLKWVTGISDSIYAVAFGYPLGWIICSVTIFIYYKFARWEKHRVAFARK